MVKTKGGPLRGRLDSTEYLPMLADGERPQHEHGDTQQLQTERQGPTVDHEPEDAEPYELGKPRDCGANRDDRSTVLRVEVVVEERSEERPLEPTYRILKENNPNGEDGDHRTHEDDRNSHHQNHEHDDLSLT